MYGLVNEQRKANFDPAFGVRHMNIQGMNNYL
jgi:hypothetical protein